MCPYFRNQQSCANCKGFFAYKEEERKVIWLMKLPGIIKAFRTFQFIKMKKREWLKIQFFWDTPL
jgi:hypothetical protein